MQDDQWRRRALSDRSKKSDGPGDKPAQHADLGGCDAPSDRQEANCEEARQPRGVDEFVGCKIAPIGRDRNISHDATRYIHDHATITL
jgi:hypothetical protein